MGYPTVYPTGVTVYDPERAFRGYTLFQAAGVGALLIDMSGREVQLWKGLQGFPNKLLPEGRCSAAPASAIRATDSRTRSISSRSSRFVCRDAGRGRRVLRLDGRRGTAAPQRWRVDSGAGTPAARDRREMAVPGQNASKRAASSR